MNGTWDEGDSRVLDLYAQRSLSTSAFAYSARAVRVRCRLVHYRQLTVFVDRVELRAHGDVHFLNGLHSQACDTEEEGRDAAIAWVQREVILGTIIPREQAFNAERFR